MYTLILTRISRRNYQMPLFSDKGNVEAKMRTYGNRHMGYFDNFFAQIDIDMRRAVHLTDPLSSEYASRTHQSVSQSINQSIN